MTRFTRRNFLRGAALAPLAAQHWWAQAAHKNGTHLLYVGTQTVEPSTSKGIYTCRFDAATGQLSSFRLAVQSANPTFLALAPGKQLLFAAHETDTFHGEMSGAVSGFRTGSGSASLASLNEESAKGAGTCHVAVDHTGRCLLAANYTGGSAASFRIAANGQLSAAVSEFHYHGHGLDRDRQEAPHAHWMTVSPDNRFVYINDLGLDCIHIYRLDAATATLTPNRPSQVTFAAGSGPRMLLFHPNGKRAYCVSELSSIVDVLDWNASTGSLTSIQRISILPEGAPHGRAAQIIFDRKGDFAYVANREDDFIATFQVDPSSGKLEVLGRSTTGGKTPRHIALDPSEGWLLVANQGSDSIAVFKRDRTTGRLAAEGATFEISHPQCLVFG